MRELPAKILARMHKVCAGQRTCWMQCAEHPERPGLARLDKIALQWRYWSDDYSTLCPGGVDEEHETLDMCDVCYAHLNRRRCRTPPKFALANGFQFNPVPPAFLHLTVAEWHVVRPFRVVAMILELHLEDPLLMRMQTPQIKLRGNVVAFPQHSLSLVKTWPTKPDDLADSIHVVLLNPHELTPDEVQLGKILACNRKRILAALEFLASCPLLSRSESVMLASGLIQLWVV